MFALGAMGLLASGCATTSVASAPLQTAAPTLPTVPPTTVPPTTVPPTTVPPTTVPPTTQPPATTVPPAPTTTVPANIIAVPVPESPIVAVGTSDGAETSRAQWRLLELGFWLQEANGDYGLTTRQAVMAFQKFYGLTADGVLGQQTADTMTAITERPRGSTDAGTMVEIDKRLQLLFLVNDGITSWIFNVSTGSEIAYDEPDQNSPGERQTGDSVTRTGLFDVYRERAEGWWEGDLGEIYRPKYFSGGIAVHGSNNIPNYPASHGCVRVSVPAMDWIWEVNAMPMDLPVWVHGNIPGK
ncbi:MAG TPA: L,D-transpeptidase family protein [Ilumatobacter sp.]|nr:L,D-transpeptidase family protein [Ilumatobacter sp.]